MDDLEELSLIEKLEVYRRILKFKIKRRIITLPEMAMLSFVEEWLSFAKTLELAA